jgi:DNA-binding NarL/FixJ family response regulator
VQPRSEAATSLPDACSEHVSRLLVKLDAVNRVQIAILAHEAGLLD